MIAEAIMIITLSLIAALAWYPCGCDQPPCESCSDDDDHISVTIAGIGDDWCSCSGNFNDTWICSRQATNACIWSTSMAWSGASSPCGSYTLFGVSVGIATFLGGNLGWRVIASWISYEDGYRQAYIRWSWNSGSTSAFDCTATRTLTYEIYFDDPTISGSFAMCSDHMAATCQVN